MKNRLRKKYANIDASGVKEIAEMQCQIDNLEDFIWRMAMCIKGVDDGKTILQFSKNTKVGFASSVIWEFITKHREKKDESKGV